MALLAADVKSDTPARQNRVMIIPVVPLPAIVKQKRQNRDKRERYSAQIDEVANFFIERNGDSRSEKREKRHYERQNNPYRIGNAVPFFKYNGNPRRKPVFHEVGYYCKKAERDYKKRHSFTYSSLTRLIYGDVARFSFLALLFDFFGDTLLSQITVKNHPENPYYG